MKNFWQNLGKPFFVLAPMDDVTDTVLRQMMVKISKPDVLFTEFTSVEGLCSSGFEKVSQRLKFTDDQHPIVAQIWGSNPECFKRSAALIAKMGFDGIDINMGCPETSVVKRGCCSALINNPEKAKQIIEATKKGSGSLPVSVKTRLGFSKIQTDEWIGFLLSLNLPALTIHARTVKEMSKVPAHWDEIKKTVELKNKISPNTIIIGNGDVEDYQDGIQKAKESGVDGIMIGRGIFKNPFAFEKVKRQRKIEEILKVLVIHAQEFDKTWGKDKNFVILRKFFKSYVHSFNGATDLRNKLMQTQNLQDVKKVVKQYLHPNL